MSGGEFFAFLTAVVVAPDFVQPVRTFGRPVRFQQQSGLDERRLSPSRARRCCRFTTQVTRALIDRLERPSLARRVRPDHCTPYQATLDRRNGTSARYPQASRTRAASRCAFGIPFAARWRQLRRKAHSAQNGSEDYAVLATDCCETRGSRTMKALPRSAPSLTTVTVPPCSSHNLFTRANPKPNPPWRRSRDPGDAPVQR